jgi:hypothetical protein
MHVHGPLSIVQATEEKERRQRETQRREEIEGE